METLENDAYFGALVRLIGQTRQKGGFSKENAFGD